jgi:hypothetical protein
VVGGRAHKPSEKLGPTVDGGPRKKEKKQSSISVFFWVVGRQEKVVGRCSKQ